MKQLPIAIALLATASGAFAANKDNHNTINYQLASQTWVKATSAKVTVSVNASLNAKQLATFQDSVMEKLNGLSQSDKKKNWRITSFTQNRSQSGLENVVLTADKRLPAKELASISNKVSALSHSGVNYKVSNIDFSPSFEQVQKSKQQLRQKMLQTVLKQLDQTNGLFKGEAYHLKSMNFNSQYYGGPVHPVPMASFAVNSVARKAPTPSLNVSQKIKMTANVELST